MKTRKNPPAGEIIKAWICPNAQVLKIPAGRDWKDSVPNLLQAKAYGHKTGLFYKGIILNERLYVYVGGFGSIRPETLRKLQAWAKEEGLTRGVIIEHKGVPS